MSNDNALLWGSSLVTLEGLSGIILSTHRKITAINFLFFIKIKSTLTALVYSDPLSWQMAAWVRFQFFFFLANIFQNGCHGGNREYMLALKLAVVIASGELSQPKC